MMPGDRHVGRGRTGAGRRRRSIQESRSRHRRRLVDAEARLAHFRRSRRRPRAVWKPWPVKERPACRDTRTGRSERAPSGTRARAARAASERARGLRMRGRRVTSNAGYREHNTAKRPLMLSGYTAYAARRRSTSRASAVRVGVGIVVRAVGCEVLRAVDSRVTMTTLRPRGAPFEPSVDPPSRAAERAGAPVCSGPRVAGRHARHDGLASSAVIAFRCSAAHIHARSGPGTGAARPAMTARRRGSRACAIERRQPRAAMAAAPDAPAPISARFSGREVRVRSSRAADRAPRAASAR